MKECTARIFLFLLDIARSVSFRLLVIQALDRGGHHPKHRSAITLYDYIGRRSSGLRVRPTSQLVSHVGLDTYYRRSSTCLSRPPCACSSRDTRTTLVGRQTVHACARPVTTLCGLLWNLTVATRIYLSLPFWDITKKLRGQLNVRLTQTIWKCERLIGMQTLNVFSPQICINHIAHIYLNSEGNLTCAWHGPYENVRG